MFATLESLGERPAAGARHPVVDELPELGVLLGLADLVDRAVAQTIETIIELQSGGETERVTGVSTELWLEQVAGRTSSDVRMLMAAAELLPRLPGTRAAFRSGELSWSQVRAIVLACRRLRAAALEEADARVQDWVTSASDASPDTVTRGLQRLQWEFAGSREVRRLEAAEDREQGREFVALQPRLDGSGGRFFGDAGAENFALLDAALNEGIGVPAGRGTFLDAGDRPAQSRAAGRQRAERLFSWAAAYLGAGVAGTAASAGAGEPPVASDGARGRRHGSVAARAGLLLRMELSTLLGGALPADLLTTLTGGRLRVTARTARRLIEEGVELRTVVVDDQGSVVGVGRASRTPPGWLRDVALALNATCTGPCCDAAARVGQLDHAQPWQPTGAHQRPGTTDVDNVAPLCARQNRVKEEEGWQVRGTADGGRVWRHPRSGIVYRHLPDHWPPPTARGGDPPGDPIGDRTTGGRDTDHRAGSDTDHGAGRGRSATGELDLPF